MTDKYEKPRPAIPSAVRRAVEVESGHSCAIQRCGEHTYLETHHINGNREDNRIENLILLCDKHHKMADNGVIDRKALLQYKGILKVSYNSALLARIERLEQLVAETRKAEEEEVSTAAVAADPDLTVKSVSSYPHVLAFTLEQLAIKRLETDRNIHFERNVRLSRRDASIEIDGLYQNDQFSEDIIVEVKWMRKRYLDGPGLVEQLNEKVFIYELMTGRPGRGILIYVVPKNSMKESGAFVSTEQALQQSARKPDLIFYSYNDLGFDPGPITAGVPQLQLP